jgi:hypothetical protein
MDYGTILNEKLKKISKQGMNMKKNEVSKLKWIAALGAAIIAWLCWNGVPMAHAQAAPNMSPQLQEVVKLTQAHMNDDVILAYIHNSGASYNLSADDILYLNTQGVTQPVISALLQAKGSAPNAPSAPISTPSTSAPPISAPQVNPPPPDGGGGYAPQPVMPPPSSEAPPGSDISLTYFQSQLAPYGMWTDIPGYGQCWVPSVEATTPDWRPYFNAGHWEYTEDGWYWKSDYPWGQYTFHYGRWTHDFHYGWVWVPGYNWGPGWVSWRHAEGVGYCGWAPLPPGARFEVGVGLTWDGRVATDVDFGLAPDAYVFIPFDHFWAHDYIGFRAPLWRVPDLFRVSVLANHYAFVGGHFMFEGIGRDRMALWTHHDVFAVRIDIRDPFIARSRDFERGRAMDFHDHGFDHGRDGHGFDSHGHDSFDHGRGGDSHSGRDNKDGFNH